MLALLFIVITENPPIHHNEKSRKYRCRHRYAFKTKVVGDSKPEVKHMEADHPHFDLAVEDVSFYLTGDNFEETTGKCAYSIVPFGYFTAVLQLPQSFDGSTMLRAMASGDGFGLLAASGDASCDALTPRNLNHL